jgi:hypothetical protein
MSHINLAISHKLVIQYSADFKNIDKVDGPDTDKIELIKE